MNILWITIAIVGVATYATRVLPLLWLKSNDQNKSRPLWLDRLGPCLLAAMAIVVIMPNFSQFKETFEILAAAGGLMAAGSSMWFRRDPGIATLVGMLTFYMLSS